MNNNTLLIFTASYGQGHIQAAKALRAAANLIAPEVHVVIIDFLEVVHPRINAVTQNLYLQSVKYTPALYRQFYMQSNHTRSNGNWTKSLLRFDQQKMHRIVQTYRPAAIISTFPYPSTLLSFLKKSKKLHCPAATAITDYVLHQQWIHPYTDLYFVASPFLKQTLMEKGIKESRIHVSGIPVHPSFHQPLDMEELRQKYQLTDEKPTILVMGGAHGNLKDMRKICHYLSKFPQSLQLLIVCGKNKELYTSLSNELSHSHQSIRLFGFVDHVQELIALSDLVLTKAGGLTVSETLSMARPLCIYRPIPGQEEGNASYLESYGAAVWAQNLDSFQATFESLMRQPRTLEKMALSAKNLSHPDASAEIIRTVQDYRSHLHTLHSN